MSLLTSSLYPEACRKVQLADSPPCSDNGIDVKPRGSAMLKMKKQCEKCQTATPARSEAYICSYECTFCEQCACGMKFVCPNCSGELVRRPRRLRNPVVAAAARVKSKLMG